MKMNDLPKSLAVVASTDARIYRLYGPVMRKLINEDVTVYAVAPPGKFVSRIEKMGSVFIPWAMDSWILNPLSNFGYVIALVRIYRRIKPDMVHHFTVKPNVYGAIAAKLSGVPVVFGGVTGLGERVLAGRFEDPHFENVGVVAVSHGRKAERPRDVPDPTRR